MWNLEFGIKNGTCAAGATSPHQGHWRQADALPTSLGVYPTIIYSIGIYDYIFSGFFYHFNNLTFYSNRHILKNIKTKKFKCVF